MSLYSGESVGENIMVTNADLARGVEEQKEKNRLLEEAMSEIRDKLQEVADHRTHGPWARIKARKLLI